MVESRQIERHGPAVAVAEVRQVERHKFAGDDLEGGCPLRCDALNLNEVRFDHDYSVPRKTLHFLRVQQLHLRAKRLYPRNCMLPGPIEWRLEAHLVADEPQRETDR